MSLHRCTGFFSQRPKALSLVVLVGCGWSRAEGASSVKGGGGGLPHREDLKFSTGSLILLRVYFYI